MRDLQHYADESPSGVEEKSGPMRAVESIELVRHPVIVAAKLRVFALMLFCSPCLRGTGCTQADLPEIVARGAHEIQSDWAANSNFAWIERIETPDDKPSSRTYQVVMIDGSSYYMLLANADQPLDAEQAKHERGKLRYESERRKNESPEARRKRVESYTKQSQENGALLTEFPDVFIYTVKGEDTMDTYPACVLTGLPKPRSGPQSRVQKVLSGMRGTVWVHRESLHTIRAEVSVISPVPVFGILARVMPGTFITIRLMPVNDTTWMITEFKMNLTVTKFLLFRSTQISRTTYSNYRLNSEVLEELLSKPD